MTISYKLLLPLFLLPFFSIAQSNYQPGYIVNLKGDTSRGFIDYREWTANPNSISFKKTITDDKKVLTPDDIVFFNVSNSESYQSYKGKISMDVTDLDHISGGRDSSFKIASVFLKILQKGKNVDLYSYADDLKKRFYISEGTDYAPQELIYKVYFDTDDKNNGRTVNDNTYQKQLFALANKYNAIDDYLERTFENPDYSEGPIIAIVSRINKISKAEYKKSSSGNSKAEMFLSAGANIITFAPNESSPYYAAGGRSYTSFGPAVSVGVNLLVNQNTRKLQLRADISVAGAQYKDLYENKVNPYIGVKFSFNDLRIAFMPQIIYNFYNERNFKIYGGIGFALAFHTYSNIFFGPQNPSDPFNGTNVNNPYYFDNLETPLLLKAGIQFSKKYEIFVSYISSVATMDGVYFQMNNTNKQVGIIYLFD